MSRVLWLATGNRGKVLEFKQLLSHIDFEVKTTADLPVFTSPDETGDTFLANALIKSRALKGLVPSEDWILSDDSGLCVDALNGLPGIHSARYAGAKASFSENIAKLLKMMQLRAGANRNAHFACTLSLITPDRNEVDFSGELHGEIALKATGSQGFGYDPIFIPKGYDKTLAELLPAEKNKLSHRALAGQKLLEHLKSSN